jgi:hypothetical protein
VCAGRRGPTGTRAPRRLELADIVQAHGDEYPQTHRLAKVQHRALRAIAACRTAVLGGRRETCDQCGAVRITYNSCRNRHCPKCQTLTKARWLAARRADLLPIPYFHVVFTLPHDLNALAQGNPRVLYTLLFRAAAATLLTFGRDPRHLGGTIGITAILHTWGQNLSQHLHLHCLVTGGALARDRSDWITRRSSFLFPVRALSTVFRATYLAGLCRAFDAGQLTLAGNTSDLADRCARTAFLGRLHRVDWIVYAKRPFAGPSKSSTISGGTPTVDEFLRRFLLHIVPRGFMRIRHFGLLANRTRCATLARCRQLLDQLSPPPPVVTPTATLVLRLIGVDLSRCPVCGEGRMQITATVLPVDGSPDSS